MHAVCTEVARGPQTLEALGRITRLGPREVIEKAVDKLWLHGGVRVADDETLETTGAEWARGYEAQRKHRRDQLTFVRRYAEATRCRMLQLGRYFGDDDDAPCGQCDVCAPAACIGQKHRAAGTQEVAAAERIVALLSTVASLAKGQLFRRYSEEGGALERRSFEHVLAGLVRSGTVHLEEATFTSAEGERVTFQRARLVEGASRAVGAFTVVRAGPERVRKRRATSAKANRAEGAALASSVETDAPAHVVEALKRWRKREALRRGVPAFRVLTDRVLEGIASLDPSSEAELLQVKGLGLTLVRKHGEALLAVLREGR